MALFKQMLGKKFIAIFLCDQCKVVQMTECTSVMLHIDESETAKLS